MARRSPRFTRSDTTRGPVLEGRDAPEPVVLVMVAVALAAGAFALAEATSSGRVAALAAALGLGVAALLGRALRFRLRLEPEGPTLERTLLGLAYARLALPTAVRARREGLLDWGDDGEDGLEALTGLALEGRDAPFEPLLIGTRADADALPGAIEAALDATYPGAWGPDPSRLGLNRPWNLRLQAALASRVARTPQRDALTLSTPFAGLLDWETPTLSALGALGFLVAAGALAPLGGDGLAFALRFTVVVLGAWRALLLLREDRVRAEPAPDGGVARLVFERRWLGIALRRRAVEAPRFVTMGSWRAAHPLELSAWPAEGLALDAQRAALDAEAARKWRAIARR